MTREYRPEFEVESAGTDPVDFISEPTINFLRDRGAIQFVKPEPDHISQRAVDEADKIVCMMPEHRKYLLEHFNVDESKIEIWHVKDGIRPDVDPQDSLEEILQKVRSME